MFESPAHDRPRDLWLGLNIKWPKSELRLYIDSYTYSPTQESLSNPTQSYLFVEINEFSDDAWEKITYTYYIVYKRLQSGFRVSFP